MKVDFTTMHKKMIEENEKRSKTNEESISNLKISDATIIEQLHSICEKVGGLTKVLWWLGTSIFAVLLAAIISYVLKMVGLT